MFLPFHPMPASVIYFRVVFNSICVHSSVQSLIYSSHMQVWYPRTFFTGLQGQFLVSWLKLICVKELQHPCVKEQQHPDASVSAKMRRRYDHTILRDWTCTNLVMPISVQGSLKKEFPQNLGGCDVCYFCHKRVYVMERLSAEGKFFHRSCFKCEYCATTLRLSSYAYDIEDGKRNRFFVRILLTVLEVW